MISRDDLTASMTWECHVTRHLYGKLTPAAMEYRPSDGQRSTLELLRYLSYVGIASVQSMLRNDWRGFGEYQERAESMTAEEFPEAMRRQEEEIARVMSGTPEEEFATRQASLPGSGKMPLAVAIMNGPVKWLAAYKLQLFLYAKANGATDIGTINAWAGKDAPPR